MEIKLNTYQKEKLLNELKKSHKIACFASYFLLIPIIIMGISLINELSNGNFIPLLFLGPFLTFFIFIIIKLLDKSTIKDFQNNLYTVHSTLCTNKTTQRHRSKNRSYTSYHLHYIYNEKEVEEDIDFGTYDSIQIGDTIIIININKVIYVKHPSWLE